MSCLDFARTSRSYLVVALAIASTPRAARAELHDPTGDARSLGGHTFVQSPLVDWPFITSQIASTTSVGVVELEMSAQTIAARFGITGTRDFLSAEQTVVGSVAVTPWLSLGLTAQGSLVVPEDGVGAVLVGENGTYGGHATVAVRLFRSERFQAAALVSGGRLRPVSLVPSRLPRAAAFQEGDITSVRPALAVAYAFSRRVGIQASAGYAFRRLDLVDEDTFGALTLAAALEVDVRAFTLVAGAQRASEHGESVDDGAMDVILGAGDTRWWVEGGVVYAGRPELELGVMVTAKVTDTDEDSRWFAQLRIAYHFL
jgi:hypothetical protein